MLKTIASLTVVAVLGFAQNAAADDMVMQASNFSEFTEQFCNASRTGEHIFVVPAQIFTTAKSVSCSHGDSMLRMSEPSDDPGHAIYNIDPPSGVADAFDCDGKADIGMDMVALNCLPANSEKAGHRKT